MSVKTPAGRKKWVYAIFPALTQGNPAKEKESKISNFLSTFFVPLSIAFSGLIIQAAIAHVSTNKDYVNVAVQILSKESSGDKWLREWAVGLLEKTSPVSIPKQAKESLIAGELLLPSIQTERNTESSFAFSDNITEAFEELTLINSAILSIKSKPNPTDFDLRVINELEVVQNRLLRSRFGDEIFSLYVSYKNDPLSVSERDKTKLREISKWADSTTRVK